MSSKHHQIKQTSSNQTELAYKEGCNTCPILVTIESHKVTVNPKLYPKHGLGRTGEGHPELYPMALPWGDEEGIRG